MADREFLPEGYAPGCGIAVHTAAELMRAMERGYVLEGTVVRCDSSDMSLHVDIGGMHGIIPREEAVYSESGDVRDIAILTRVGKRVAFTVKSVEHTGGAVTAYLSRKDVQKRCTEQYISRLTPGDVIPVRVTHLEPFGAFVDIGAGIVSLASVDTLSVSRISHPSDRLAVGECGFAVVRSIDRECGRIYMSFRELYGTWEENAAAFSPGETVTGIVRSVEDYGIFVELAPNLAGLAEYRAGVKPGDGCAVYIKSMIPERMKIKLVLIDSFPNAQRHPAKMFIDPSAMPHMDVWRYSPAGCPKIIETVF